MKRKENHRCYQCAYYEVIDDLEIVVDTFKRSDDSTFDFTEFVKRSCCTTNPYEPKPKHPFKKACGMFQPKSE